MNDEFVCARCNGTGDIHRADGEYLGVCDCDAGTLAFEIAALNRAVDDFADEMKKKLVHKASEGYQGWSDGANAAVIVQRLVDTSLLVDGEYEPKLSVNIANYAMMLWHMNRHRTGGTR